MRSSSAVPTSPRAASPLAWVVFFVAFLAAATAIRLLVPAQPLRSYRLGLTEKIRPFAESTEPFDIVMVGNSRVIHGLDPAVVDDALQKDGCRGRSINLGSPAMNYLEAREVAKVIADRDAPKPMVWVTFDILGLPIGVINEFSPRDRSLLTWQDMTDSLRYRSELPDPYGSNVAVQIDLAAAYSSSLIPLGNVHDALIDEEPPPIRNAYDRLFAESPQRRGYVPLDDLPEPARQTLRDRLSASIQSGVFAEQWRPKQPSADQIDKWITTIDAIQDLAPEGVASAHVLIPSYFDSDSATAVVDAWAERQMPRPLINLVTESAVPGFTTPDVWVDATHLNRRGAESLSRAFGTALCNAIPALKADR
jgi:hypothetical protein